MLIEMSRINNQLWIAYLFAEDMISYLLRSRGLSYISPFAYYQFRRNVRTVFTEDIGKLLNYYALKVPLEEILTDSILETLKDRHHFESFIRIVIDNFMYPNITLHRLLQILSIISKICIYCCRMGNYIPADVTIYLVGEALNNRMLWSEGRIIFYDHLAMDRIKHLMEAPAG